MQNELDAQQRKLLWLLLVQPEAGMFLNETRITFKPAAQRATLSKWGFIEEFKQKKPNTKGGKAIYVRLLDKGWEWCHDHMNEPFPPTGAAARDVLQGLLAILGSYFGQQNHCCSLGDLVNQAKQAPAKAETVTLASGNRSLTERICETCRSITGGEEGVRIRLADIRSSLSDIAPEQLDAILLQMEREGSISLYRLDNPEEITEADKAAALVTIGGTENHILYEGGLHS